MISLIETKTNQSKGRRFETAHDNFVLYWNPAHAWILLMAYLGLAYNLKVGCEEKDPEKAISVLKKAAVYSKIPTRDDRFRIRQLPYSNVSV